MTGAAPKPQPLSNEIGDVLNNEIIQTKKENINEQRIINVEHRPPEPNHF